MYVCIYIYIYIYHIRLLAGDVGLGGAVELDELRVGGLLGGLRRISLLESLLGLLLLLLLST